MPVNEYIYGSTNERKKRSLTMSSYTETGNGCIHWTGNEK